MSFSPQFIAFCFFFRVKKIIVGFYGERTQRDEFISCTSKEPNKIPVLAKFHALFNNDNGIDIEDTSTNRTYEYSLI